MVKLGAIIVPVAIFLGHKSRKNSRTHQHMHAHVWLSKIITRIHTGQMVTLVAEEKSHAVIKFFEELTYHLYIRIL